MLRQSLAILSGVAFLSSFGAVFNTPSYAAGTIQFSCDTLAAHYLQRKPPISLQVQACQ
ncbi:MAG: hypothetical protein V7L23_06990 [Nostoc sp.]|uniref:hypothetical protein n=1 Tax=Nostoc sp. TaxID=1180 RepID=UPI002FF10167